MSTKTPFTFGCRHEGRCQALFTLLTLHLTDLLGGIHVPEEDLPAHVIGLQHLAIGAKVHADDSSRVPPAATQAPVLHLPGEEVDQLVSAGRRQDLAIR